MKIVVGVKAHFRQGVRVRSHFKTIQVKASTFKQAQKLAGEDAELTGFESFPERKKGKYVYQFEVD